MKSKTLYVRAVGILLAVSLLCSACSTQEAGKQSLSATGTAVMTPSGVESELPDDIEDEEIKPKKTTEKDKDGTVWDISKEVKVKQDGYTYHVYLSKDGKKSWIYQADPGSERKTTLSFPEEVQGAVLTKLGRICDNDDFDWCYDIFGNSVEPWHENKDSWESVLDKNTKGIRKIICPPAVKNVAEATFCGFADLEEIELPKQLHKIERYLLFLCKNLKKIILPYKLDFTKTYGCLMECNHIEEVVLPEGSSDYCIKDGMLLSKDKKTLYQVFVTGKTVKVPEGVTRIAARAVNAVDISKIRSVRLPSTLKNLNPDAILDENEEDELGGRIRSVTVASNNPVLAQAENCIYGRATGTLAVFVGTKKSMTLPEEIRYIGDAHLQLGREIERLIVPAGFKAFKTNKCFGTGITVREAIEFCSVTPPEVQEKGKKGEGLASVLYIVPEKGEKAYKKWLERLEGKESKFVIKKRGGKTCIARKSDIEISGMYSSEGARNMKKYGF